jgi:hypothetical protein
MEGTEQVISEISASKQHAADIYQPLGKEQWKGRHGNPSQSQEGSWGLSPLFSSDHIDAHKCNSFRKNKQDHCQTLILGSGF